MRKLLFIFVFMSLLTHAHSTGDSLSYLTAKDTIFLKVDDFGNKLFGHQMEPGQTLYSMAKFYGLKTEAVLAFNPNLDRDDYHEKVINVPIPDSSIVKVWENGYPKAGYVPVVYVVKHGDNFYRIAKHFFGIEMDSLKLWNGLEETMMFTGMQLHVGFLSLDGIPDSLQLANTSPLGATMQKLQTEFEYMSSYEKPKFHNGAAYWQREKRGKTDYYALHRYAPIGSVIQISNPMKRKRMYAKVIARIPDRAYGDDIIVVLSPTIAKLLGAREPRFFVEVRHF